MFIAAIGLAMLQGLNIDCGCFSGDDTKVGWGKILEDLGLLACAIYVFLYPVKKFTVENIIKREI